MIAIFIELIPTGILQGLILAFVATGIMIPFRLLNAPDLAAEGSYPLGGILCASLLVAGVNPFIATILAACGGGVIGFCTAQLHLRLRVNTLLAGIILSTMVYSLNLRLMGKPNLPLFTQATIFSDISHSISIKIIALIICNLALLFFLYKFLLTEKGLRLRAVGLNPGFSEKQGIHLTTYISLGFFLGNFLAALGGSLMVQNQSYADIGMGVGIVIHALAALMIGESIVGQQTLRRQIIAPFIGALIYQQIQGLAISMGLAPSDLKLVTGIIVLIAIGYKHITLHR